ncbi:MAG TPA: glycosyltransferase family 87 protein [Anaerolineales bacterium]|nr:glycosyltransferase family 87 protein [Anaerolineales bacterium]
MKIIENKTRFILVFVLAIAILGAFFLPIPSHMDAQILYVADLGFVKGVSPYDLQGHVDLIAALTGKAPENILVQPFPYPPWYVLSTFYLGLLPQDIAARIWFEINFAMTILAIWFLTDGWKPKWQLTAMVAALLFMPVIGSMYIGQYNFTILLGAAMLVYSLKKENVPLTAIAFALLTFKPHLGVFLAIVMFIYLIFRRDEFSKRSIKAILLAGAILFVSGFIVDFPWPVHYFESLTRFRGIVECDSCASLPVLLMHLATGEDTLELGFLIGVITYPLLFLIVYLVRRDIFHSPDLLISIAVPIVLMSYPYLFSYDYVLFLIPLLILFGTVSRIDWFWVLPLYFLPTVLTFIFVRDVSRYLPLLALSVFVLQLIRARGEPSKFVHVETAPRL